MQATVNDLRCPMTRRDLLAIPAIGPYPQASLMGVQLFPSGRIGPDPATDEMVPGGVEPETRQVLTNPSRFLPLPALGPAQE